jgi:hypothetical protein
METLELQGAELVTIEEDIEWKFKDLNGVSTISLIGGSSQAGDQGEMEQFIPLELQLPGKLLELSVDFLSPIDLHVSTVPFTIPGIIGMTDGETHPEWRGEILHDIEHRFEIVNLGEANDNGKRSYHYSLRVHPIDHFTDGTSVVYEKISITYSYTPYETLKVPSWTYGTKPLGPIKYLIITHKDLVPSLEKLAQWKSQKGVFARIVTTEEIASQYQKRDFQAEMRTFIQDMEETYDLDYLLIVGDVNKVKTRHTKNLYPYTAYGEPSTFASDSYFACVSPGSTWNNDGDSSFLEQGELDDPVPDLAVGRLASNYPQLVSDWVDTLIQREKNFVWDQEMETAIFIAGDPQNVPGYPPDTLEHFWDTYAQYVFDDRETLYYDGTGTMSFSATSFKDTIGNKHQASCYFSHGTQTGLPGLFSNNQIQSLSTSGPEGSFFTMACLTGYFDSSSTECFAEAMTENKDRGVLGYMGSSRLAVGGIDDIYSGDAPGLEEDYWRGVREAAEGNITPTVGDIYRYALTHFANSFAPFPTDYSGYSAQRTFLEYNLFGEPEAPLFFHEPEKLSMEFILAHDNSTIWARVTNSTGSPVEDATVSLFRYNELGVAGTTNSTGEVTINIPPSNGGTVNVTANKPGELPVNDTITLPDELVPTPLFKFTPDEPDGYLGIYVTNPTIHLFSDENASIEYSIDNSEIIHNESGVFLKGEEGFHNISFRCEDGVGHISDWIDFNFTVDTTPPSLWLDTDPIQPDGLDDWFISPPWVKLNGTEELTASYYRINSGVESLYAGPFFLYNGVNTISIRALDLAGNENQTDIIIKVDTTLPYSTINISHVPNGDNGYYVTIPAIILNAFDDNGASPLYRWDNGSWEAFNNAIYPPKGVHKLEFRAIDNTGNLEERVNFQWFRYDPDPPILNYSVFPAKPDGKNRIYVSRPVVNLSVDPSEISEVTIRYFLSDGSQGFSWTTDSLPYIGPLTIPEGNWRLHMLVKDEAGNQHFPMPIDLEVDLTKPDILWNITPSEPDGMNMWYVTSPVLSISELSPGAQAYMAIDENETWMVIEDNITLPAGTHTINIIAVDIAGNLAESGTFSYKFDDEDPIASLGIEKITYFPNEKVNVSADSSTDNIGPMLFKFETSDGRASLWLDKPRWDFSFNSTGEHNLTVTIMDQAGRLNSSRNITITVIERPVPPVQEPDLVIEPFDPDPIEEKGWTDAGIEEKRFVRGGIILILLLIIAILLILVVRKTRIREVEWEGEDDWMDEDWVDIDLDEEPVVEDDVLIFEE